MELTGEHQIPASREVVWEALNDPEVLKQCIPGCDSLEKTSDTEMTATVTAKVGPVKATFKGSVTLSDINPPSGYTISGEGKGGAAGFAKGSANVELEDSPEGGTLLRYEVDAMVGGKLAQIGARLIDSTAKKMSREFFGALVTVIENQSGTEAAAPEPAPTQQRVSPPQASETDDLYGRRWKGYSPMTWISGGILVAMILFAAYRYLSG